MPISSKSMRHWIYVKWDEKKLIISKIPDCDRALLPQTYIWVRRFLRNKGFCDSDLALEAINMGINVIYELEAVLAKEPGL